MAMLQRGTAEFVGTFTLIFVGRLDHRDGRRQPVRDRAGARAGDRRHASTVGHISGGHFNPAVTLGFFVTRGIEPKLAAMYWFAQFVGAMLAAFMLTWLRPQSQVDRVDLGVRRSVRGISGEAGVAIEAILTFFLVWVIFATAADPRGAFAIISGLAIGLTITLDIYIGGPFTGAAMNPARAFEPEIVQDVWSNAWV
jgi:aquaporin TIP